MKWRLYNYVIMFGFVFSVLHWVTRSISLYLNWCPEWGPQLILHLLSCLKDQITITGYEQNAIAARDAIQAIVDELEEMISEDITLDSRVHARIIGARGKGIRKIMDEFKVKKNGQ